MIDVKELRIGNWVDPDNAPRMFVRRIGGTVGLDIPNSESDLWEYDPEQISPIPLTPEMLAKCGFERKVQILGESSGIPFEYIDYRLNNFVCIQVKDTFEVEFSPSFYNVSDRTHVCTIQYLHQLQNLYFALTQTELKIEL